MFDLTTPGSAPLIRILGFVGCLGLFVSANGYAAPASRPAATGPTSQAAASRPSAPRAATPPSAPRAATKPGAPATPKVVTLRIGKQGHYWVGGQRLSSVVALVEQAQRWKAQRTTVQLEVEPGAPQGPLWGAQSVLTSLKVQWKRPASQTSPPPQTAPSARTSPPTRPEPGRTNWSRVPLKRQKQIQGKPGAVEVRVQLWQQGQALRKPLPTALVQYQGKKRQALGHLQANRAGQLRYKLIPETGASYRISVLWGRHLLEFPVMLERQKDGLLYTRLTLQTEPTARSRQPAARPLARRAPNAHPRRPAPRAIARMHPDVRKPATPQAPAGQSCEWSKVPMASMKGVTPKTGAEMRIQLLFPKTMRPMAVPTGLLQKLQDKREPVARAQTTARGCVRYLVSKAPGVKYEIALLLGTRLSVYALPAVEAKHAVVTARISLKQQKLRSTLIESLNLIVEPISDSQVRVVHVVQLFYAPTSSSRHEPVFLPLAEGATQVHIEQNIPGTKWKQEPKGLRLNSSLKPGTYRLMYYYSLPRNGEGTAQLNLTSSQRITQHSVLFGKGLLPKAGRGGLKTVHLGQGKQKRPFLLASFPGLQKGQSMSLTIVSSEPTTRGLLGWIKRWKEMPNKKNKLIGLAVLLSISLLGLFWVFATPASDKPRS